MENILNQFATLLLAGLPVSIFLITWIEKIFGHHNPKLAQTTAICTDLSGTLTKHNLVVQSLLVDKQFIRARQKSNLIQIISQDKKKSIKVEKNYLRENTLAHLAAITANLCSYPGQEETENIIRRFFLECGFNKIKIEAEYEKIQEIPSSDEKKISTVVAIKKDSKEIFAFTKGHPEKVLAKCGRIIFDGKKVDLTPALKAKVRNNFKKLEQEGQKIITFAYKGLPLKRLHHYSESFTENDLIFIGMVGIGNPINYELKESIHEAKTSGIKIYITTGQKEHQAVSTALKLGIVNQSYFEAISSANLGSMNDQKLQKLLINKEKDFVFADLHPEDKNRIMQALKDSGETVAIANHEHNHGLKTIVQGIRRERITRANSRKYISHVISFKLATFLLVLTALILGSPNPLSIALIILIDITVNFLLEITLKHDQLHQKVMGKDFRDSISTLFRWPLLINAGITCLLLMTLYFFTLVRYGWSDSGDISTDSSILSRSTTIIFFSLVIFSILNAFNVRTIKKSLIHSKPRLNQYLLLITVVIIMLIYLLFTIPESRDYLGLTTLRSIEWQMIIFMSILLIISEEVVKFIQRKKIFDGKN